MAILSLPVDAPFLASALLFEDELLLATTPDHPLATAREISLQGLDGEDFILLRDGHCLADQVEMFCRQQAGFSPRVSCRTTQLETVIALVRAGMGISFVPRMAADTGSGAGLAVRSLSPPIYRSIAMVWRRNRSHCLVARAFRECVSLPEHAGAEAQQGIRPPLRRAMSRPA